MISKKYSRKEIVRLIHNLIFVILFVWLDLKIVELGYRSITSTALKVELFRWWWLLLVIGAIEATPILASQLLYLFGSNILFKNKFCDTSKFSFCLFLISTIIAFLMNLYYLIRVCAFMYPTYISFNISYKISTYGPWIVTFVSLALYSVGKLLAMRKVEANDDIT